MPQPAVVNRQVPGLLEKLLENRAMLMMGAHGEEFEELGLWETDVPDEWGGQDLYGQETNPADGFDAALEEVLHLLSVWGYEHAYPDGLGSEPTTLLTEAMDIARGGHFESIPNPYPEQAWYHYDDWTCDYRCMAVEYFYWALTTKLGAQSDPERCEWISNEWALCTPNQLESGDTLIWALLTDPTYKLPTVLPDGDYSP